MVNITIKGSIPSKKNSKQWVWSRSQQRKFLVPSDTYELWHEEQSLSLAKKRPKQAIERCKISFRYFGRDKRRKDLDNQNTSILDLLKDCAYIKDDNWFVVQEVNSVYCGTDKENPRCEVEIEEL